MIKDSIKKRDVSIDIVKFFAVLLITNSHMDIMYTKMSILATGGAIGDCLFFFASGFTILMGHETNFGNYYKRRIKRIYPTVLSWSLIYSIVWGGDKVSLILS